MSDNSELIYRLRRAANDFHQNGENERLMNEAIDALLANQPGHPFPDWVRDILRSNDADWGARLKREQEKVETLRAELHKANCTINRQSEEMDSLKASVTFLRTRLGGATEELIALRALQDNFDLQAANKALTEENENLIRENEKLRLERDRLEIDRESLREDMHSTDMENKALREAMHDIATTANRAQQDPD